MGKEMKNIIVLRNIYSQFFEEVIFVLKKDMKVPKQNLNMVYEARKIIEDYINKHENYSIHENEKIYELKGMERGNKLNAILNVSMVLSIILFAFMIMKLF